MRCKYNRFARFYFEKEAVHIVKQKTITVLSYRRSKSIVSGTGYIIKYQHVDWLNKEQQKRGLFNAYNATRS